MYLNACADSVAVNLVLAPISLAFFLNASYCLPDAPDIALTSLIAVSKVFPTFIDSFAISLSLSNNIVNPCLATLTATLLRFWSDSLKKPDDFLD